MKHLENSIHFFFFFKICHKAILFYFFCNFYLFNTREKKMKKKNKNCDTSGNKDERRKMEEKGANKAISFAINKFLFCPRKLPTISMLCFSAN